MSRTPHRRSDRGGVDGGLVLYVVAILVIVGLPGYFMLRDSRVRDQQQARGYDAVVVSVNGSSALVEFPPDAAHEAPYRQEEANPLPGLRAGDLVRVRADTAGGLWYVPTVPGAVLATVAPGPTLP